MSEDAWARFQAGGVESASQSELLAQASAEDVTDALRLIVDDAGRCVALAALLGMMRRHGGAAGVRRFAERYRTRSRTQPGRSGRSRG